MSKRTIRIVFDGPPGAIPRRFVEVEDMEGRAIEAGRWVEIVFPKKPHQVRLPYWALELDVEGDPDPIEPGRLTEHDYARIKGRVDKAKMLMQVEGIDGVDAMWVERYRDDIPLVLKEKDRFRDVVKRLLDARKNVDDAKGRAFMADLDVKNCQRRGEPYTYDESMEANKLLTAARHAENDCYSAARALLAEKGEGE